VSGFKFQVSGRKNTKDIGDFRLEIDTEKRFHNLQSAINNLKFEGEHLQLAASGLELCKG